MADEEQARAADAALRVMGITGNENWEFNADVLDTDELPASTI